MQTEVEFQVPHRDRITIRNGYLLAWYDIYTSSASEENYRYVIVKFWRSISRLEFHRVSLSRHSTKITICTTL